MKCKSKEIRVTGTVYDDRTRKFNFQRLRCICTNDEKGKTLSVDNGAIQFSIPMELIAPYFEGDYKKLRKENNSENTEET
jgi:hypothetical protein